MARTRTSYVALVLLVAGCPNERTVTDQGLDFIPAKENGRMTPSAICDAYLSCLAAAEPQAFPTTLQTYQADGPCWKTPTAAAGCETACKQALDLLIKKYPAVGACRPAPDAGVTREAGPKYDGRGDYKIPQPPTSKDVDILFMVDNSNSMEVMQDNLIKQFPKLIEALRSAKLGPAAPGAVCTATNTSGCKLPNLRIGVVSSDLGAGNFSFQTCETPGGDQGKLHNTPGKFAPPGCAVPKDPWINYYDSGSVAVTNVVGAKSPDPVEQVKEAFSCIAYLGVGGCGFEHQLEATKRALDGCQPPAAACKTNPGFIRPNSILVVVLLTNEDDCSAKRGDLFDPSQQGLNDPLGPLNSFRCTEFGLACDEKLRSAGVKHNCQPALDWLYNVGDYVSFFKSLRPNGNLIVTAIAGPLNPFEVGIEGSNPVLKASCNSAAGSGVPAIRIKAVTDGLGWNGIFNQGVLGGKLVDTNICSIDFSPALQFVGDRISPWY